MYLPEQYNKKTFGNYKFSELRDACESGAILEAVVTKCDRDLNLEGDLGNNAIGIIPFNEFEYPMMGKPTKTVAVLSKVGKAVKFKVKSISKSNGVMTCRLSRKEAQMDCYDNYIKKLKVGQVISARATYVESYGVFCDVGCGIVALLPIENLCTTRINDPKNTMNNLGNLKVVVKSLDNNRITLTHKELLGTWEEEASKFEDGVTVTGIVRIIEDYGIFVQLTPNLVGLADVYPGISVGDSVSVFVKSIFPDKMKIKLIIIGKNECIDNYTHFEYKIPESGFITDWVYSPESCPKRIETHF